MQKEILLVSNYFPPEKGAASNRMFSLAKALGKEGYKVAVICPLPNYPSGKIFSEFKGKIYSVETASFGKIIRLWTWPSNSENKFIRLLSMLSFSVCLSIYFLLNKIPKKIFIQYSPVFVGFTAVFWGRLFSKKIILNVSDLWPLAGLEMGILKKGIYYSILERMERFCYRNSDLIIGQSEEILHHINEIEKEKQTFLYRNIPNFNVPVVQENNSSEEIKLVYAGLLGLAQGIFKICKQITIPENLSFHIYGAGPEKDRIKGLGKKRIYFHGEMDRNDLHKELQQYDISLIPLRKRIYGSVPSKIYEYSLLGLPILYFAGGEGGNIVQKKTLGWIIPENDLEALQTFLNTISQEKLKERPKKQVQENAVLAFNFEKQFEGLLSSIEET